MPDVIKYARAWAVTSIAYRAAVAVAIIVTAVAVATGDGGTLTISWVPGG